MRGNGDPRHRSLRARRTPTAKLIAVVALVAGVIFGFGAVSAAAPSWAPDSVPSPSPFRAAPLQWSAVACSSPTNCFAVGSKQHQADTFTAPMFEQWDGSIWSTHENQEAFTAALSGVTCPSANLCFAVGTSGNTGSRTFIERWDGTSWNPVASKTPGGVRRAGLLGVSCASVNNCFAVGSYGNTTPKTLIEHWDGSAWKTVTSPNPKGAVNASLSAVSCRTATSCIAVGGHVESGDNKGGVLVEKWNGKTWTIATTPTPKVRPTAALLGATPLLDGVSCSSATNCVAVGYTASDALIERWNGTAWSIFATPKPPAQQAIAELRAVSCSSATDCSAVGVTFLPVDEREGVERDNSIIEHWNGKAWAIVPNASGVPTTRNSTGTGELSQLSGVSCPTPKSCAAVGNSAMGERWDGQRWSLTPVSASTSNSRLNDVTCPAVASCFALGTAEAQLEVRNNTLIEHWDGTTWSILPSPTPSGVNVLAVLNSISCVSTTDCTAVGGYDAQSGSSLNGGFGDALIEHWNGASWANVAAPSPTNVQHDAALTAVSCVTATSCNAVGNYNTFTAVNGQFSHRLAEHWNGTSWSIVAIPGPSEAMVNAVSCSTATSCFAVGGAVSGGTMVARWNGTTWSTVAAPAPPSGTFFQLRGLSCASATDCTAVGSRSNGTTPKTLIEHWDGTSWSISSSPSPPAPSLNDVSCTTPTDCTAVGAYGVGSDFSQPFIEQWDGSSWSEVFLNGGDDGFGGSFLNGVTCTSPDACIAVGYRLADYGSLTLVEQST